MFFLSFFLTVPDHLKRKVRRRPFWGRGIIRKKKIYKKGIEEEEEEPEGDTTGPCDSCLTLDEESSCDTMPPQPNGHHAPSLGPSTEEESSNEPPVAPPTLLPAIEPLVALPALLPAGERPIALLPANDPPAALPTLLPANEPPPTEVRAKAEEQSGSGPEPRDARKDAQAQSVGGGQHPTPAARRAEPKPETDAVSLGADAKDKGDSGASELECVNGDESMDSLDSSSPTKSCGEGDTNAQDVAEGSAKPGREEQGLAAEAGETQVLPPQEGSSGAEVADEGHDAEDCDKEGNRVLFCYTAHTHGGSLFHLTLCGIQSR